MRTSTTRTSAYRNFAERISGKQTFAKQTFAKPTSLKQTSRTRSSLEQTSQSVDAAGQILPMSIYQTRLGLSKSFTWDRLQLGLMLSMSRTPKSQTPFSEAAVCQIHLSR